MLSTPSIRYGVFALIGLLAVGMLCLGVYRYQAEGRTLQFAAGQSSARAASNPPAVSGAAADTKKPPTAGVSDSGQELFVHVTGAVAVPGVYRLPTGARVNDALEAAGGAKPEGAPHSLNLARHVVDGDKIYVPTTKELAESVPSEPLHPEAAMAMSTPEAQGATVLPVVTEEAKAPAAVKSEGKTSINKASAEELDKNVSGIGKATAEAIVAYRAKHGPFKSLEELSNASSYCKQHWEEWLPELTL